MEMVADHRTARGAGSDEPERPAMGKTRGVTARGRSEPAINAAGNNAAENNAAENNAAENNVARRALPSRICRRTSMSSYWTAGCVATSSAWTSPTRRRLLATW